MADRPSLILILGDQLSPEISSLRNADRDRDIVLMCELRDETGYVGHHKQKLVLILSAMRHFASELEADGWTVDYVRLTDRDNTHSFSQEVARALKRHKPGKVVVTEAGEWRVQQMLDGWPADLDIDVDCRPDKRFICSKAKFEDWAEGRKEFRMEHFYREMRRDTGLLMDGDKPEGGKWNFDHDNRKPAKEDLFLPKRLRFKPDEITREVIALVEKEFPDNFGSLDNFGWAVTAKDAERAFDDFLKTSLADFGTYQDAMLSDRPFLYHGLISSYINLGLLDPLAVCRAVAEAYGSGKAPLNAAEGFIRQIIGWREYVRGIYWLKMPDYREKNALSAKNPLPWFYWSGETDMNCLRQAIGQTRDEAYAHHIQRLMVTGTFALLAGIDPHAVHEWYLAVYIDAFEWVELPNTLGMSQYADGGLLGSKPYAASGAYINRMSNYCEDCAFDVKSRTGKNACPFNYLYWDFIARHEKRLGSNPRMRQIYATWHKMDAGDRKDARKQATEFLETLCADTQR